jgi:recombination protein RecR
MNAISKLAEYFQKFPGIGPRQAKRFVYFLLTQEPSFLKSLAEHVSDLSGQIARCVQCQRFYDADGYAEVCDICSSPNRDGHLLMIVEKDADLDAIEKSRAYNGRYFVLGGTVPLLNTEEHALKTRELRAYVEKNGADLSEVIMATGAHPEGEMTADHIRTLLLPLSQTHGFSMSQLGRGLSTGTELEYSDQDTIKNALENRK